MSPKPPLKPIVPSPARISSNDGWGRPAGSSLRHYIRGQRSLCRTWGYFGDVKTDQSAAELCEECRAALERGTLPATPA
jgi:hypothetical protein